MAAALSPRSGMLLRAAAGGTGAARSRNPIRIHHKGTEARRTDRDKDCGSTDWRTVIPTSPGIGVLLCDLCASVVNLRHPYLFLGIAIPEILLGTRRFSSCSSLVTCHLSLAAGFDCGSPRCTTIPEILLGTRRFFLLVTRHLSLVTRGVFWLRLAALCLCGESLVEFLGGGRYRCG
jgi:hypothetical protein